MKKSKLKQLIKENILEAQSKKTPKKYTEKDLRDAWSKWNSKAHPEDRIDWGEYYDEHSYLLKEDVYWGDFNRKEKSPPTEDEIQDKAEFWVEENIGLDAAGVLVRYGGNVVDVFTRNKNAKPDPMLNSAWEESANELTEFLNMEGMGEYEVSGWTYRGCSLTKG